MHYEKGGEVECLNCPMSSFIRAPLFLLGGQGLIGCIFSLAYWYEVHFTVVAPAHES